MPHLDVLSENIWKPPDFTPNSPCSRHQADKFVPPICSPSAKGSECGPCSFVLAWAELCVGIHPVQSHPVLVRGLGFGTGTKSCCALCLWWRRQVEMIGKTLRDPHVFHPNFSAAVVGDPQLSNYREDRVRPNKTKDSAKKHCLCVRAVLPVVNYCCQVTEPPWAQQCFLPSNSTNPFVTGPPVRWCVL